jgi:hypothetical protein
LLSGDFSDIAAVPKMPPDAAKPPTTTIDKVMQTFWHWARLQSLLEAAWYTFDPQAYNQLFDGELEKVVARVKDPACRQAMERLRGSDWTGYIASMVRHAGYRDRREIQEKTHEVVTKLLMGTLFRGYDERQHGPMDRRFKASVGNSIRNIVQKEQTRKRLLPSVSIGQEFVPGNVTAEDLPARSPTDDEKVIHDFRRLVRKRLGDLGLAVLDARLDGIETKALVGSPALGSPGKHRITMVVAGIKALARNFAASLDDPELLRRVERAMGREEETAAKRRATAAMATRQAVA